MSATLGRGTALCGRIGVAPEQLQLLTPERGSVPTVLQVRSTSILFMSFQLSFYLVDGVLIMHMALALR